MAAMAAMVAMAAMAAMACWFINWRAISMICNQ